MKVVVADDCITEVPVPNKVEPAVYVVPSTGVGVVALVLLTTKYPVGAEAAAVKLPEIELDDIELNERLVGWSEGEVQGAGGVQVYVKPNDG